MNILRIINQKLDHLSQWMAEDDIIDDNTKRDLSSQFDAWKRLRNEVEFQLLTPIEKQAKRIAYLAICRKANGNCKRELETILMYDLIMNTLPYIKALNHHDKLNLIEELCQKEIDIIDESFARNVNNHVDELAIENVFKPYFETVYPFKKESFKECYEKVEFLYNEMKKLNLVDF